MRIATRTTLLAFLLILGLASVTVKIVYSRQTAANDFCRGYEICN